MTRLGIVAGLSRDGAESFAALLVSLDRMSDEGRIPPCRAPERAHWWTSDNHQEREAATHGCQSCPIQPTCQNHADAESAWVWGGNDRTKTTRTRQEHA